MPENNDENKWFINHYKCDDCGIDWQDEGSATCDSECPECGKDYTPYNSDDKTGEDNPREFLKNIEKFTTTDQVFDNFVNEGWNEQTQLILIKQFLEKNKLLNRLNEHLKDVVDL